MRNENWSTSKSKIYVSSRLPPNPASGYSRPDIRKVAVEVECDDDEFIPVYEPGCDHANLLANIPSGSLRIASGGTVVVDCGISIDMPPGYRCRVSGGVPGLFIELTDSKRVKVHVFNAGDEVVLQDRQMIGKISVEPVYIFEWITKG